jgi:hypothetical protein
VTRFAPRDTGLETHLHSFGSNLKRARHTLERWPGFSLVVGLCDAAPCFADSFQGDLVGEAHGVR